MRVRSRVRQSHEVRTNGANGVTTRTCTRASDGSPSRAGWASTLRPSSDPIKSVTRNTERAENRVAKPRFVRPRRRAAFRWSNSNPLAFVLCCHGVLMRPTPRSFVLVRQMRPHGPPRILRIAPESVEHGHPAVRAVPHHYPHCPPQHHPPAKNEGTREVAKTLRGLPPIFWVASSIAVVALLLVAWVA